MARKGRLKLTAKRRQGEHITVPGADTYNELWRLNWKSEGLPYCGIYIVTTDSRYPCKIGISQNPAKRLASLQTSHWRLLQISEYRWCGNEKEAKQVEQAVHERLKEQEKLLHGEWFDIRPEEAVEAIEWVGLIEGIAVNKHIPKEIEEDFLWACQAQHETKFLAVKRGE